MIFFENLTGFEEFYKNHKTLCGISRKGLVWNLRPIPILTPWDKRGFANGYVGLLPNHALYGVEMENLKHIKVHGGITCAEQIGKYWVVGFDVAHMPDNPDYWNKKRCRAELNTLVQILENPKYFIYNNLKKFLG